MAPTIDKALRQEKQVENHLMHLALVDITGSFNKCHKFMIQEVDGNVDTNNKSLEYIICSDKSFKLTQDIIGMKAPNFLKPF